MCYIRPLSGFGITPLVVCSVDPRILETQGRWDIQKLVQKTSITLPTLFLWDTPVFPNTSEVLTAELEKQNLTCGFTLVCATTLTRTWQRKRWGKDVRRYLALLLFKVIPLPTPKSLAYERFTIVKPYSVCFSKKNKYSTLILVPSCAFTFVTRLHL